MAIADQAKKANVSSLTKIANDVFPEIYTSLKLDEIVSLLMDVANYNIVAEDGFPREDMRATGNIGGDGSCVVPLSLESNVVWLHEFLFDETGYEPSAEAKAYSQKVYSDTNKYLNK